MKSNGNYRKPNTLVFGFTKFVAGFFTKFIYKRKYIRNELKGVKGPYVLICNHESQFDFVNLYSVNKEKFNLVISKSFYESLPVSGILPKLGLIPKQQFQTKYADLKKMKAVVENGRPLVIYPAGLMPENGLSTPIPQATYKFLKWLGVDVYVARISGGYFVKPKWGKGFRSGKTDYDVYKLIDKSELNTLTEEEIKEKVDGAILFDAYFEQEKRLVKYKHGNDIVGLQNVLYRCPKCKKEFTTDVKNDDTIYCKECGFQETADGYGFLHASGSENEIRYASWWDAEIYDDLKAEVYSTPNYVLSQKTTVQTVDKKKHKFVDVGKGELSICRDKISLKGVWNNEEKEIILPTKSLYILPSVPGKQIEIQDGDDIYRCVLDDGKYVMKYIHLLKIFYEINNNETVKIYPTGYKKR